MTILLASSINGPQKMLLICCEELAFLDLKLSIDKPVSLKMGKAWKLNGCAPVAGESAIKWVTETRYLGLYLRSGPQFSCNFEKTKIKYYRASNAILAKLGKQNNPTVTVHYYKRWPFPFSPMH